MNQAVPPRKIAVIGAGIVGVSTALLLQRDGHQVTLLDPTPPGCGTSFGNAGSIAIGGVYPTSSPGNWKQVPKMLMDPITPLSLKPGHLLRNLPFFLRFLAEGRAGRVEEISIHLSDILKGATDAHRKLLELSRAQEIVRPVGWLKVYSSQASFDRTAHERAVMARRGINFDILSPDEIRQLEPGLSPKFTHGYHQPDNGFVSQPIKLTEAYFAKFQELGGSWLPEKVRGFELGPNGVEKVKTTHATHSVDSVVIAAGAFSHRLLEMLDLRILFDTERGYHLNLNVTAGPELRRPTVIGDQGFVLAPMQDGLRLTTGAEFAGLDAPPDFSRIKAMLPMAREALPGLEFEIDREWLGFRPSTPDSVPVVARLSKPMNVFANFGHGHLGLTMAARTGEMIADMVAERHSAIDLAPYRLERVQR